MKDVQLQVQPASGGWWIECDPPIEPTFFHSGARAETVARNLAIHLSGAGHDVRVLIEDRANQGVATQRYFAL
ncbi:MAG: hypothetical protein KKE02_16640 [Alphaproteobacteria bacterium]|nr:hypothetical protein [Alphaproteobacteria bacterium]MBU1516669.1 hypothetical protein [Alphaproteobacteria bacterium]MBU2094425.1 hypothetical protein [Alphaproteobacteria bacterium]MBU2152652.1 hypothetical protein [Alphaproteobacteria bacterium]MBU2306144.1 hypothetical protein [Alphaproteobacteria bacterium]